MRSPEATGVDLVLQAATGAAMMQAFAAAAELRIADALGDGPQRVDALAEQLSCNDKALRRLFRALCSVGMCDERERDVFGLTPTGVVLQSHGDASIAHWTVWVARYLWPEWAQLAESVRTGETGRKLIRNVTGMEHLERDAKAAGTFHAAMGELTQLVADSIARHPALDQARTVVDVGGGCGELLSVILRRHAHARGVLFDRPHAIERARERMQSAELLSRCQLVTGDFFRDMPAGGDVYVLKSIIHDWDDAASERILRRCRDAMNAGGCVLVVEHVMPERLTCCAEHQEIARRDLAMLLGPGGRERTDAEFRELFGRSGLLCRAVAPATLGFSMFEVVASS